MATAKEATQPRRDNVDKKSGRDTARPLADVTVIVVSRNTARSLGKLKGWAKRHGAKLPHSPVGSKDSEAAESAREKMGAPTASSFAARARAQRLPAASKRPPRAPGQVYRTEPEERLTVQIKARQLRALVGYLRGIKGHTLSVRLVRGGGQSPDPHPKDRAKGSGGGQAGAAAPRRALQTGKIWSPAKSVDPLRMITPREPDSPITVAVVIRRPGPNGDRGAASQRWKHPRPGWQ